MRAGEADQVVQTFGEHFHVPLVNVRRQDLFLSKLEGVTDPEQKLRKLYARAQQVRGLHLVGFAHLAWGVEVTPALVFTVFVVIIVSHAMPNAFGINLVSVLASISAWWHAVGVLITVVVLWLLPQRHQSVSVTLTGWHNETGWTFQPYVFLMVR